MIQDRTKSRSALRCPAVLAKATDGGWHQILLEETDLYKLSARRMMLDVSVLDRVVASLF